MSVGACAAFPNSVFFELTPRADATSFQVGYLGINGFCAWVVGDVLIKVDAANAPTILQWYAT